MAERPVLPPIECTPWCADGNGHPGCNFLEDQWCGGVELRSPASRYPDVLMSDGVTEPEYVTVYAMRLPGEPAHIAVGRGEEPVIAMTPDEARQVIEHMQLVLGQIGGAR
jgi:hypothetical protein